MLVFTVVGPTVRLTAELLEEGRFSTGCLLEIADESESLISILYKIRWSFSAGQRS
jgi:hypothetical protein